MYLAKKGRCSQAYDSFSAFGGVLLLGTEGNGGTVMMCCENHGCRHQKRQAEELAEHTVKRACGLHTYVPGMGNVVHTFLALLLLLMDRMVHMNGRQNQHWQKHSQ